MPVPVMVPFPETDVVRVYDVGEVPPPPPPPPPPDVEGVRKAAETERFRERVFVQVGVEPEHEPPQRLKVFPAAGVAVSRTTVRSGKTSAHDAVLQTMPFAETVPFPVRVSVSVRVEEVPPVTAEVVVTGFVVCTDPVLNCVLRC
jgi:hypothetical protein